MYIYIYVSIQIHILTGAGSNLGQLQFLDDDASEEEDPFGHGGVLE